MSIRRITTIYLMLTVLLLLLAMANILMGSSSLRAGEALSILLSHDTVSKFGRIVWDIRMPRILAAILLGGEIGRAHV